jgi:hypothetical protein
MIRPKSFGWNSQTATSNFFQQPPTLPAGELRRAALREFDSVVRLFESAGARPLVLDDTRYPPKPDAIFPNNWVSFHDEGTAILYPLATPARRLERRRWLLRCLAKRGYRITRTLDLSYLEARGHFLEGTGSLVLDRRAAVAYAALSARTHREAIAEFCRQTGYRAVIFGTDMGAGRAVYHTNVVLSIGTNFAVLCPEVIRPAGDRAAVIESLSAAGLAVIEISRSQMQAFAANLIEIDGAGGRHIALSARALASLRPTQRRALETQANLLSVPIDTIEGTGGGGIRCMLAEVPLPIGVRP